MCIRDSRYTVQCTYTNTILGYIGSVAAANEVSGNFIIDTKVEAPANTNAGEEHRKSSICVGTLLNTIYRLQNKLKNRW